MKEIREKTKPVAEFLAYKIRAGEISQEGGDKIWRFSVRNPDTVDDIIYILEMDLPEAETIKRVEKLA